MKILEVLYHVKLILLTIVLLLILGVGLLLLSPFYFFRWLVANLLIKLRSDLCRIVHAASADFIECEGCSSITIYFKIDGHLLPKDFFTKFESAVISSSKNDRPLHPELKMYFIYWLGFLFWSPEENFSFEDHRMTVSIPRDVADEDKWLHDFEMGLLQTPFDTDKSPWIIALVQGASNSYVFLKLSHAIGDGHSIFQLLLGCADRPVQPHIPQFPSIGPLKRTLYWILSPIGTLFQLVKTLDLFYSIPLNPIVLTVPKSVDGRVIAKTRFPISSNTIKIARRQQGVSFSSVLVAAVGGAFSQHCSRHRKFIPSHILLPIPIPYRSRPAGLRNHFITIFPKVPTGNIPWVERLQECQSQLIGTKTSPFPGIEELRTTFVLTLPTFISRRLQPSYSPTSFAPITLSIFPGPSELVTVLGKEVLDMSFSATHSGIGILLTALTYNGKTQLALSADLSIFPEETMAEEFIANLSDEIDQMAGINE